MKTGFKLSIIGQVHAAEDGFCLELNKVYAPALTGLDGFGCLNVLWWANLLDDEEQRAVLTCEKPYKNAPAELGIFATRSPLRPNPICLTVVSVLHIDFENGRIHIPYIDAEDGTPILDIKPYHPATDRVKEVSVPVWCRHWPQWLEDSARFNWAAEFETAR
jgi:tRNA-Thr(GGU) m(6)t(6)A37 methyltransferase TsaA